MTCLSSIELKPYEQMEKELEAFKILGGWIQYAKLIVIKDVNDSRCRLNQWYELCELAQEDPSIIPTIYQSIQNKLGLDSNEWEKVQSFHLDMVESMPASCLSNYKDALSVFYCEAVEKMIQNLLQDRKSHDSSQHIPSV